MMTTGTFSAVWLAAAAVRVLGPARNWRSLRAAYSVRQAKIGIEGEECTEERKEGNGANGNG